MAEVDYSKVAKVNNRKMRLGHLTIGNPSDPCVVISPGGGATKAMSLFWVHDLVAAGPFFVILYDLRCSGESEGYDVDAIFGPSNTTPGKEMKKMFGIEAEQEQDDGKSRADDVDRAASLADLHRKRNYDLPSAILEQLHDYDAHASDVMNLLDAYKIEKAHVMGLSQGGLLTLIISMQYPERILSGVAAASPLNEATSMLGMFAKGAEDFYDGMKLLEKERGAVTQGMPKDAFVSFKVKELELMLPGFAKEVYTEMASKEHDYGVMDDDVSGLQALAFANWRNDKKFERLHQQLRDNTMVPLMLVQGKKDPICWYGHFQKLFATCGHCVAEVHEYGHNFGPPDHQKSLMARIARWMKQNAGMKRIEHPEKAMKIGGDTFASGVSAGVQGIVESDIKDIYDAFCQAQSAADTLYTFDLLLNKLGLVHLKGRGIKQFLEISKALQLSATGLNFKQKRLIQDLEKSLTRAHGVVARVRSSKSAAPDKKAISEAIQETLARYFSDAPGKFNRVVVCGAGPVGLRAACELALLGFEVKVVEKRPNFSRANILTFWDGSMQDMLALGAKAYFPDLTPTGGQKYLGTRQIQVCLLKTFLLLGGMVEYGMEICGLSGSGGGKSWQARFRKYLKQRRAAATDFQTSKDYAATSHTLGLEKCDVDQNFLGIGPLSNDPSYVGEKTLEFDAYFIAEGGWSDSTRKLGFDKAVENFKSVFGLVINMQYDPTDMKEKNLKSAIHFALSGDFPLRNCRIQSEFIEYLKGETHFYALVVSKKNFAKDQTEKHLAKMTETERGVVPEAVLEQMRFASTQKGLLEMGVFKEDRPTGKECLAESNLDTGRLYELAREIVTEMGLPQSAKFYETNPVQLFDFSRRARCVHPVKILENNAVLGPKEFAGSGTGGSALVFPVGDALQEPNWTQGLGINKGFHTAMNQAYSLLIAREKSLKQGVEESVKVHEALLKMQWGGGNSGLAGSGTGCPDLKPFKEWDADPRSRFKNYK